MRTAPLSLLALTLAAGGAVMAAAASPSPSPYAGEDARAIKALSQQQIDELAQGRGMGLAKAAELNGWPGPLHVLELAEPLGLDAEQRGRTEALFRRMQAAARALGAEVLATEAELETAFRTRRVTPEEMQRLLQKIGHLGAELRGVHLQAHLEQTALLRPEQVDRYNALRGYRPSGDAPPRQDSGQGHRHRH